jgi:hypothetical protein
MTDKKKNAKSAKNGKDLKPVSTAPTEPVTVRKGTPLKGTPIPKQISLPGITKGAPLPKHVAEALLKLKEEQGVSWRLMGEALEMDSGTLCNYVQRHEGTEKPFKVGGRILLILQRMLPLVEGRVRLLKQQEGEAIKADIQMLTFKVPAAKLKTLSEYVESWPGWREQFA